MQATCRPLLRPRASGRHRHAPSLFWKCHESRTQLRRPPAPRQAQSLPWNEGTPGSAGPRDDVLDEGLSPVPLPDWALQGEKEHGPHVLGGAKAWEVQG